jgi:hypothetical protein
LNKNSTIFDRILLIIEKKGIKNVAELATKLGYDKPQKIYRLKQEEESKPSYDIIYDFTIKFEDLNVRWFITGVGEPFITDNYIKNAINEPLINYPLEVQQLKDKVNELEIEKKSILLALREFGVGLAHTSEKSAKGKQKKSS